MHDPEYTPVIKEASFAKTIFAGFIDLLLSILILWAISYYQNPRFLYEFIRAFDNTTWTAIMIHFIIRMLAIVISGRTPGMMLLGMTFLNGQMSKLSFMERLLASVFILYRGVNYYQRNWVRI